MVLSMVKWHGKVAVVTGASAGIGSVIVEKLVKAGLQVVGLARRLDRMLELSDKLATKKDQFYPVKCDMSNEEDILIAFKWIKDNIGPVSILINNAGVMTNSTLIAGDSDVWRNIFAVNVIGLCIATREAIDSMQANGINGHIIHINSIVGHRVPDFPGMNVYPASKHAVTALTESLRKEINSNGFKIKITSISPGVVKTELVERGKFTREDDGHDLQALPFLEAEDIADAVAYALSTPPHVQVHEIIIKPMGEPF